MDDTSKEEKIVNFLAEIVRLTDNPALFHEIIEILKKSTETRQLLEQTYDAKDEMLEALDMKRDVQSVEIMLREQEIKLRSELEQNIALLKAIKRTADAKAKYHRLKNQADYEESQARMKEMHKKWEEIAKSPDDKRTEDFNKKLAEFYKGLEDYYKSTLETRPLIDGIYKESYISTKRLVDVLISGSRKLIFKYRWKRLSFFLLEQGIRILWLLILVTLLPGILISKVEPWFLSLLILPCVAWLLTDRFVQPSLERRIFTPKRRNDLKLLVSDFYDTSIWARCRLALMKKTIEIEEGEK